jgi:Cu/Ag efflux pump CusA
MSLGGIIIAIGTVVDMGIIMTERIYRGCRRTAARSDRLGQVEPLQGPTGPRVKSVARSSRRC